MGFADQIWRQCVAGNLADASTSARASSSIAATLRVTSWNWVLTAPGAGLGEDDADDRADHILGSLGHSREHVAHDVHPEQHCQDAPSVRAPMVFFSPGWASEMTSFTPSSPWVSNDRRSDVQNPSFSTSKPRTSLRPSAAAPKGTATAWAKTPCRRGACNWWHRKTRTGSPWRRGHGLSNAPTSSSRSGTLRTWRFRFPHRVLDFALDLGRRTGVHVGLHHDGVKSLVHAAPGGPRRPTMSAAWGSSGSGPGGGRQRLWPAAVPLGPRSRGRSNGAVPTNAVVSAR